VGEPKQSDFTLVETPIPELGAGEVLNRTIYLSLVTVTLTLPQSADQKSN